MVLSQSRKSETFTAPIPYLFLFWDMNNRETFLQHIRMAEIEQASLKSEQLSDKSSSPALPDDLSLDEHTAYQLMVREGKVGISRGRWGKKEYVFYTPWKMPYPYVMQNRSGNH